MLILGRKASLEFCVFPHNCSSPLDDSSIARIYYRHIPEFDNIIEKNLGAKSLTNDDIKENKLRANKLAYFISEDIEKARTLAQWLGPHLSPETRAMYDKGSKNSFNKMFDILSNIGEFKRNDILVKENSIKNNIKNFILLAHKNNQEI